MSATLEKTKEVLAKLNNGELRLKNADKDELFEVFSTLVQAESIRAENRMDYCLSDKMPSLEMSFDETVKQLFNQSIIVSIVDGRMNGSEKSPMIERAMPLDEQAWIDKSCVPLTYAIIDAMERYIAKSGYASAKEKIEFHQKLDLPLYEAKTKLMLDELLFTLQNKVESHLNPSRSMSA